MNKRYAILIILFGITAFSQSNSPLQQRENLKQIRSDIEQYEKQISEKKKVESNTIDLISNLDREINVSGSYIKNLKSDIQEREHLIARRRQEIQNTSQTIDKLRDQVKARIVNFYKHGQRQQYELLFSSKSFSQVQTWLKFQKLIVENDRRMVQSLVDNVDRLQKGQQYMQAQIYEKERNIQERSREEEQLRASLGKRKQLLNQVRSDTRLLEKQLEELRESQREVKSLITKSEEKRLTRDARKPTEPDETVINNRQGSFASLKGKLPWPASGKITSHYGRHRHPIYKTVTENLGIEIKAPLGTPVITVDQGQVQTITWQRGLGNIVIISHGDGYYTVYSHLDEIQVSPLQQVNKGQVIGTVGETGSLSGPILQFQIWKNTDSMDPEEWIG